MLYNLYKSIYELNREQKEYLHGSFSEVISAIVDDRGKVVVARNVKEAKLIVAKNNVFKEVVAGGLHDPETPEEMGKLIDLLEKFVGIDNNISNDNIGVFINPMSMGAKKITIRPCRIVGLMRKLDRLSRKYKREMGNEGDGLVLIRQDFDGNIGEIKTRLKGLKSKIRHPRMMPKIKKRKIIQPEILQ